MKKIALTIVFLLFTTSVFAGEFSLTEEQKRQIGEEIHRYVEDTYKKEKGKRSKDDIRKDYILGSMLKADNMYTSRAFGEKNFEHCKFLANLSITTADEKKANLDVMPMTREALEVTYSILADCYIAEVLEKVSAREVAIREMFQKERALVEKAKKYYTKATNSTFNPMLATLANFNLGFIYTSLGERKKGNEFWSKAFRNDRVLNFSKSEYEKGNMVLLIFHNDTSFITFNKKKQ